MFNGLSLIFLYPAFVECGALSKLIIYADYHLSDTYTI